jgi:CheY-like chemotaxis protein
LERWGLEVSAYDSAESALEAVRTMRPEVLMVDMQLPGIDGVEFARRVRAASGDETRRQRIILLSASLDQEVVAAASDAGIDECVSKPFDPDDLYGRLARHLSAR